MNAKNANKNKEMVLSSLSLWERVGVRARV